MFEVLKTPTRSAVLHGISRPTTGNVVLSSIFLGLYMNRGLRYPVGMSDVRVSDAARLIAGLRRQEPRTCEVCGTEVVATVRRQYCSTPCRLKADYVRHAEARRAKRRARYQRRKAQTEGKQA